MQIINIIHKNSTIHKQIEYIIEMVEEEDLFTLEAGWHSSYSLFDFIDKYVFFKWKHRAIATCTEQFLELAELENAEQILTNPKSLKEEEYDILLKNYLEVLLNFMYLALQEPVAITGLSKESEHSIRMFEENLLRLCSSLNMKTQECDEYLYLIEADSNIPVLAETENEALIVNLLQYSSFRNRGNLGEKAKLLSHLGRDLEPKRDELRTINKSLERDIFLILNNFNIRHNNLDSSNGSKYNGKLASLNNQELEKWYDRCYQKIVLAFSLLKDRNDPLNTAQLACFF